MLVGLVVGAVAIPSSLKGPATVALICPVAILILPVLDTTAAVIRRKLTGRGLATADRGHLHHVLLRRGLTVRRVLVLVAALGGLASVGALASTALKNDLYALVGAAGVALTLLATRLFGHAEFHLVRKWVSMTLWAALGWAAAPAGVGLAIRIQGTIDWDSVWVGLSEAAGAADLQALSLDVNAPELHENYHARWERAGRAPPDAHGWRLECPLFAHGRLIGRVAASGGCDTGSIGTTLQVLARIVEATERRATELTASEPAHRAALAGAR
jgi:UDP-GlcNAc:undecaprenyl-phosphate GlcNAc-1-phosphate transferase